MELLRRSRMGLDLAGDGLLLRIGCAGRGRLRLRATASEGFVDDDYGILAKDADLHGEARIEKIEGGYRVAGDGIAAEVTLNPLRVRFTDGVRTILESADTDMYSVDEGQLTVRFALKEDEAVYGLGQGTYHRLNMVGLERRMWNQYDANRFSGNGGIPFMINTGGYAVLLNSAWASRFFIGEAEPCDGNERVVKPAAPWGVHEPGPERDPRRFAIRTEGGEMDLFIIAGAGPEDWIRGYYDLTGYPPMLPKWAFGLMQCKNRYKNQKQLLEVAREYRRRDLPVDVLIIDWNWFKYFGFLNWVSEDWPDPVGMFRELRAMGIRVLAAIHPYMHEDSPHFEKFKDASALIEWDPEDSPYWPPFGIHHAMDFSSPEGRKLLFEAVKPLLEQGLAGFWTDMGELEVHPEGSTPMHLGSREEYHNLYTNFWTQALYEGQREKYNRRAFSLPRTSYAGTQRYSCAMWTGDVDCDFDVFRDQVLIGQQLAVSGQPFTCTDIGGFISMPYYDPELYVRWFQWGVFCPVFRTHGTRPDNEPWVYGQKNLSILKEHIELRYRLMPLIYSAAYETHAKGLPMVMPMALAFPEDGRADQWLYQFTFCRDLLVSPVVGRGEEEKETYLPRGDWYDFYTGERIAGGRTVRRPAPQGLIPVYARAGSIVPLAAPAISTDRIDAAYLELRVYPGRDAQCVVYEDDGETYDYERGASMTTRYRWDEASRTLTAHPSEGAYHASPESRRVRAVLMGECGACVAEREIDVRAGGVIAFGEPEASYEAKTTIDYALEMNPDAPQRVLKVYVWNAKPDDVPVEVRLNLPLGWRAEQAQSFTAKPGYSVLRVPLEMDGPQNAAATLRARITAGDTGLSLSERLNSGWATWWRTALVYPMEGREGFDAVLEPETVASFDEITSVNTGLYLDHQCFGYSNMMKAMTASIPFEQLQGMRSLSCIGYAGCTLDVRSDVDANLFVMGDDWIRVFVDGAEIMRVENQYDAPQKAKLRLGAGRHRLLVKVARTGRNEWNDRAFGFYLKIADDRGAPIEDILYVPEA